MTKKQLITKLENCHVDGDIEVAGPYFCEKYEYVFLTVKTGNGNEISIHRFKRPKIKDG